MESIVIMLREATVPWSVEVEELAQSAYKMNHPLSAEVYVHRNTAAKKLVLKKYGLPVNIDLTNVSTLGFSEFVYSIFFLS
jgi:hypothetical protein